MFVTHDPLGNPVDRRHPWNQHTNPHPQKRDLDDKYSWVMSPRWYDGQGPPGARHRRRPARPAVVDGAVRAGRHRGYVKATGSSVQINLPKTALKGPVSFEWKIPQWSQHHRAEPGPHLLPGLRRGLRAALRREGAGGDPGRPDQDLGEVRGARRGHRLRLHRGRPRRAQPPHGDPGRQDRELPPLPADPVERQPARLLRHARAVRGRGPGPADLRGERPRPLQGHRHHAHGPQLRPLPAVRRPHVPRRAARRSSCCTRPPSRSTGE